MSAGQGARLLIKKLSNNKYDSILRQALLLAHLNGVVQITPFFLAGHTTKKHWQILHFS
jgi:hypothetical protein